MKSLAKITVPVAVVGAMAFGSLSPSDAAAMGTRASHSPRPAHHSAGSRHHRSMNFAGSFPVLSAGGSGVRGSVRVSIRGSQVTTSVSLAGLAPFTDHAIHIHAGSCASPYTGFHLFVLGFVMANVSGQGATSGFGPSLYIPGARYVIVYSSLAPITIIGCSNLGTLHVA
jgi:hypothetical protein